MYDCAVGLDTGMVQQPVYTRIEEGCRGGGWGEVDIIGLRLISDIVLKGRESDMGCSFHEHTICSLILYCAA